MKGSIAGLLSPWAVALRASTVTGTAAAMAVDEVRPNFMLSENQERTSCLGMNGRGEGSHNTGEE